MALECPTCKAQAAASGQKYVADIDDSTSPAMCNSCFAVIGNAAAAVNAQAPAAVAAAAEAAAAAPAVVSNSKVLRSAKGSSRAMLSGRSAARAQGLVGKLNIMRKSSVSSSRMRALGRDFVDIEPVESFVLSTLVKEELEVPVDQRFCSNPVHEEKTGKKVPLTYTEAKTGLVLNMGVCRKCGRPYTYPIAKGTKIDRRYEVLGTIAEGGTGFIYAGMDTKLANEETPGLPVIIKGVKLRAEDVKVTGDKAADNAAVAQAKVDAIKNAMSELAELVNLRDPSVVSILDFTIFQENPLIIMEFVDGMTLDQLYRKNDGKFPEEKALAYGLSMLDPNLQFIHDKKKLYLDVTPRNFMVQGSRMRTLDIGGVISLAKISGGKENNFTFTEGFAPPEIDGQFEDFWRMNARLNDDKSGFVKTDDAFFQAKFDTWVADPENKILPEQAEWYKSLRQLSIDEFRRYLQLAPATDTYGVGRTIMFLMMNFDFMGRDRFITSSEGWNRLVSEQEVSAQATGQVNPLSSKSLVSFLKRATAIDPADRFQSAIEMAEQGWLVMREIVAAKTGLVKQIESTLFDGDSSGGRTTPDWRLLPGLKLDNDDPARGEIETALKSVKNDKDLKATLDAAALKYPKSREVQLRLALVLIKLNDATTAERKLIQLGGDDTEDFRPLWYRGILALARGNAKEAVQWFSDVVYMVPGETVPKLALGMAAELSGDDVTAIESYDSVTIVEPNHTLAAFGHARALSREGSREKAFKALKRVPVSSIAHRAAELQAVKVLISTNPDLPGMAEFQKAAEILESLRDGSYEWHKLVSEFYLALQKSIAGKVIAEDKKTLMLGASLTTRALGFKAHDELMSASHYAPEKATELRNQALLVRPVTLW